MSSPLLFLAAVLTLLGTPGPTNTLLATSGAVLGLRRSLALLVAELAGYLLAIATIRIILGPVIHAYPLLAAALKIAVALYLALIAVRLWRRGGGTLASGAATVSVRSVFVTTLLNPKALIFALSVIPAEHPQLVWFFAAFALAVPSVGFCWILLGRAIGAATGENHPGLVQRIASVALVGFAGLIAASVLG